MGHDKNYIFKRESNLEPVFLSGIQALVELPKLQIQLDQYQKLKTAALISGYRGSPLGGYDQMLWKHEAELKKLNIIFQPGLNEDLAATALWGTQMQAAFGPSPYQGVFGIWYGKGPGIDRSGDVFRTANMFGTSPFGGVLAIAGDDHTAQSSTFPHQSDGIFQAVSIPVLQPSNISEVIHFGLAGIALSRYSGLWVALKTVADVIEAAGTVRLGELPIFVPPTRPSNKLLNWDASLQWPAQRFELEKRLIEHKLPAAKAWAKLNHIDRIIHHAKQKKYAIITVGKAHQDLMQALQYLGLADKLNDYSISVYKVGMSWPLEETGILNFIQGHDKVLVIEEKRGTVEQQIKEILYNTLLRPQIFGKQTPQAQPFLPEIGEYSTALVAEKLFAFLDQPTELQSKITALQPHTLALAQDLEKRTPFFCSGCPHNTSTRVPEGAIGGAGIGCHIMTVMMPQRNTRTFSQMGSEGLHWVGAAPFSDTPHTFQNIGDGTYEHSGILAIRAAVAANTHITFKILYNDAVAMTGGQPTEGHNNPARISRQLAAEGIEHISLISEQPERWQNHADLSPQCQVLHRDALAQVQQDYQHVSGVSAIIYDQTCAAEKRRRRKHQHLAVATQRAFIYDQVCEGCGDCSVQSNCISIEPIHTDLGIKRKINQSSCNQDLSCLKGFCPSFVEIEGATLRHTLDPVFTTHDYFQDLPDIQIATIADHNYNIIFSGVGGTGVLTIAALVGQATVHDQHAVSVLDFTGLSQKNGAVFSQVRLANQPDQILSSRVGNNEVDLLMANDLVAAATQDILQRLHEHSHVVLNLDLIPTAQFVHERDHVLNAELLLERIQTIVNPSQLHLLHANQLCEKIFGESTFAHILMLGFAWQKGLLPISLTALQQAMQQMVNPEQNLTAFLWGRVFAEQPDLPHTFLAEHNIKNQIQSVDELIRNYVQRLTQYQDAQYAKRYLDFIQDLQTRIAKHTQDEQLVRTIANNLYKVMAYKDEYEVARLYSQTEFQEKLQAQFSHPKKISLWLSPPLLSRIDPMTGRPKKIKFGAWVLKLMPLLAQFKWLRGQWFDPLGKNAERVAERQLIEDYIQLVNTVVTGLTGNNLTQAYELCELVKDVRGFGPVKMQALASYYVKQKKLLSLYQQQQRLIHLVSEA